MATVIAQAWFNVLGLCLDFSGVVLLAVEWRIALLAEQREADLEATAQRLQPSPMMPRSNNPHQEVHDYMRRQASAAARHRRSGDVRGMRRSRFALAMVLITIGFICQMIGSWPGCCSAIGVLPNN